MSRVKKKPVEVEAITFQEFKEWVSSNVAMKSLKSFMYNKHRVNLVSDECYSITTLEGVHNFTPADMLITGVAGEIYPCKIDIFNATYDFVDPNEESGEPKEKSLGNTDVSGAKKNVSDLVVFGNGDMFKLLSKASSKQEGWMKSTKAMEIPSVGCVIQTTTQQRNPDGSYSLTDAVCFVPSVKIAVEMNEALEVVGRSLEYQHTR